MKKTIRPLFLLVFVIGICVSLGFIEKSTQNTISVEYDKPSFQENFEVGNKKEAENTTQTIQSDFKTNAAVNIENNLSEEDQKVKLEVLKHSDTIIEFKHIKEENINGKTFNLNYSKIDFSSDVKNVIYTNDSGDEFAYNIDNGDLRYAIMESIAVEKSAESIDDREAQKIAKEYISKKCNIEKYGIDYYKEIDTGYYYRYTRYVGEYKSSDRISIQVGFDGSIIYVSDFTDTFDGKELNYNKNFIDSKIKETIDETKVDWNSIMVCVYEGKVAVQYTVPEQCATAILSLE